MKCQAGYQNLPHNFIEAISIDLIMVLSPPHCSAPAHIKANLTAMVALWVA
jgi:hypothetical protein